MGMVALLLAACSAAMRPAPPPPAAAEKQQPAPSVGLRNVEPARAPEAPKPPPEAPKAAPKSAPAAPPVAPKAPAPATPPAAPKTPKPLEVARAAPAPAPLDLKSLEQRLKESSAIGVLTKLSLKNQVDDLVGKFRMFHSGTRPPTLTDLRPSFELLFMKVLSLLQDKDPSLAHDINVSREAIWGVLSDRQKFSQYS